MSDFRFQQSKSFEENSQAFLDELETQDSELANILRQNWDQMLAIVTDGQSSSSDRTEFNRAIGTALDALLLDTDAEVTL
jgi:hypothetical protein